MHRHGPDTAVVVGVDAQETTFGDRDVSGRFRVTLTAVRPGDDWQVAAVHIGASAGAADRGGGDPVKLSLSVTNFSWRDADLANGLTRVAQAADRGGL